MKKCALFLIAAMAIAMPVTAQLVTVGTGTTKNTIYSEPAPYGNYWWGSRHQFIIQAAELTALGVGAGANLNSIGFDVFAVNGQALVNFEIKAGLTTTPNLSLGWIAGTTQVLAPIPSYAATAGWNTHVLSAPIVWDGTSNVVIETCFNNSSYTLNCVFNQTIGAFTASRWYRNDAVGICLNAATTGMSTTRPNMQLGFAGAALPPEYQVNQGASSLDFDGLQNTAFALNTAQVCAGGPVTANIGTNVPGNGWDIALSFLPVLPASAGGITLPGGQVFNLNFAGGLIWLNGGPAPLFMPIPGSFPITFTAPGAPFPLAAQQLVFDPSNPIGVALSQAAAMNVVAAATMPLTLTDDSSVNIAFGGTPLCGPATLSLYGTAYTNVNVVSNGRLMFGPANLTWTPTVAATLIDAPSFGVWADFNPGAGGSMSISSLLVGGIRVDWTAVPYFGGGALNTFGLQLDVSGQAQVDGLAGMGVGAGGQWVGISGGNATTATDLGPVVYTPASIVPVAGPATPAPMVYAMGLQGGVTTGLTSISYIPNAGGNYDWVSN